MPAALDNKGPIYFRTGRSPIPNIFDDNINFELGKGTVIRDGEDATIIAVGVMVHRALNAADKLQEEGISCRVVNMSTLKHIDEELIALCAKETGCVVTAEDHNVYGGLGSAVAEVLARKYPSPVEFVGVRDIFAESGEPDDLAEKYGLTSPYIAKAVKRVLQRKKGV